MDLFWILTDEDLPDDGQRVLVTLNEMVEDAIYQNGWEIHGKLITGVIAWMPYPQPYQPEQAGLWEIEG